MPVTISESPFLSTDPHGQWFKTEKRDPEVFKVLENSKRNNNKRNPSSTCFVQNLLIFIQQL